MAENELPSIEIKRVSRAGGIVIEEKNIIVKNKNIKECERLIDKYDK